MNERIRELAEQAGVLTDFGEDIKVGRWGIGGNYKQMQTFAEIIVRECIEQCSKALVEYTGQPSVTHNYAVGLCQDSIKEHFYGDQ